MRWKTTLGIGAVAVALAMSGCASRSGSTTAGAPAAGGNGATTVSAQDVAGVGRTLVNADGHTLYFADQEASGSIRCVDACLRFWMPLTLSGDGAPNAGAGIDGKLSTVIRPDGTKQVTYNGKPLYTFSLDSSAGQAKGNGVTDAFGGAEFRWHAAAVTGATSPGPVSTGNNGYGY